MLNSDQTNQSEFNTKDGADKAGWDICPGRPLSSPLDKPSILLTSLPMFLFSRRSLVHALAASLSLHAVLLLSVVNLLPIRFFAPAATITVVMRHESKGGENKPVSIPATNVLPERVKPESRGARKSTEQKIVVPDRSSAFSVEPSVGPSVREVASSESIPAPAGISSGMISASTQVHDGVDINDVSQYKTLVAKAARRFKRYPELARARGWEGEAEVVLYVNALSPVPEIVLERSSGRGALDKHALDIVTQAARVTVLPEGLRRKDFRVSLPVVFSLNDD